jgi:glycosyltransferase involved in cell wall biosynthesis
LYINKLSINLRSANILLAISETTKRDFLNTFSLKNKRVVVTPLGVPPIQNSVDKPMDLVEYKRTSWGYLPFYHHFTKDEPFVLFVGGADRRRKLEDLITALNHLWARGVKVKLVLAGDSMQGPEAIATEEIQGALKKSSYLDNVVFMGFIDDDTRDWLYKHARAFIFPSRYEGFGLPVLEAMSYGCPVISYPNEATKEVAGDAPLYATDVMGLIESLESVINNDILVGKMRRVSLRKVKDFTWHKTATLVFETIK